MPGQPTHHDACVSVVGPGHRRRALGGELHLVDPHRRGEVGAGNRLGLVARNSEAHERPERGACVERDVDEPQLALVAELGPVAHREDRHGLGCVLEPGPDQRQGKGSRRHHGAPRLDLVVEAGERHRVIQLGEGDRPGEDAGRVPDRVAAPLAGEREALSLVLLGQRVDRVVVAADGEQHGQQLVVAARVPRPIEVDAQAGAPHPTTSERLLGLLGLVPPEQRQHRVHLRGVGSHRRRHRDLELLAHHALPVVDRVGRVGREQPGVEVLPEAGRRAEPVAHPVVLGVGQRVRRAAQHHALPPGQRHGLVEDPQRHEAVARAHRDVKPDAVLVRSTGPSRVRSSTRSVQASVVVSLSVLGPCTSTPPISAASTDP